MCRLDHSFSDAGLKPLHAVDLNGSLPLLSSLQWRRWGSLSTNAFSLVQMVGERQPCTQANIVPRGSGALAPLASAAAFVS